MARAREGKRVQQGSTAGPQMLTLSMALNCILAAIVAMLVVQQRQQQLPPHAVHVGCALNDAVGAPGSAVQSLSPASPLEMK